jgi:iron complex outermembrane recepter protein
MREYRLAAMLLSTVLAVSLSARADDAPADPAGPETDAEASEQRPAPRDEGIEVITVNARRRAELLQETPLSVVAFTNQDLEDQEIRELEDISALVPNLELGTALNSSSSARISIRGVGNGDAIVTADPGVGVYVDGVYLARAQGALLSVSDIAGIEVLRGPQGTLYGKNTIGGAINVTSRKPSYEFGGSAELRLGNYRNVETRLAVDVPLIPERAAMRLALATAADDGFIKNRFEGGRSRLQNNRLLAGRLQLLMQPTNTLELLFSYDQSKEDRAGPGIKCKANGVASPLLVAAANQNGIDYLQECAKDDARDNFEVAQDGPLEDLLRTYGASLNATWDATPNLTLKSISAWRRNKVNAATDPDGTPFAIAQEGRFDNDNQDQKFLSQEFNLNWSGMDGRMNVTAGLYGSVEKNQENSRAQLLPITADSVSFLQLDPTNPMSVIPVPGILFPFATTFGQPIQPGAPFSPLLNGATILRNPLTGDCLAPVAPGACIGAFVAPETKGFLKSNVTSYAAYGEATYDLTQAFSVTAGLRYTAERKRIARFRQITSGVINNPAILADPLNADVNFELSERYSKFTPALTLQYRFNDEMNVYARYARGFKSGGFNGRGVDTNEASDFNPEVLTSYELGFRSIWRDLNLIFNATYFQSIYKEIQLTTVTSDDQMNLFIFTDNAGKALIHGAEVDSRWVPIPGLTLTASAGMTVARYKEFDGCPNCKVPFAPTYTGRIGAQYALPLGDFGQLVTSFNWTHRSQQAVEVLDNRATRSPKRGLLGGRISLELPDGLTQVAVFGSNLLNREFFDNGVDLTASQSLGATLRNYAPPIRYGIEIRRGF